MIALLEPEFPELAVSKIRFLEAEGLITPDRSGSGYRKYSEADVERLRFILTAQRDHFWPLKVIREALERQDRGATAPSVTAPPREVRLSQAELIETAGGDDALVESLMAVGLITADGSGRFGAEDQQIIDAVVWLADFGIEPRHLRPFKTAADRELGLVEQMLAPSAPGRERRARAGQMAQRFLDIHSALIRKGLSGLR